MFLLKMKPRNGIFIGRAYKKGASRSFFAFIRIQILREEQVNDKKDNIKEKNDEKFRR